MESVFESWEIKVNEIINNCWLYTPNTRDTKRLLENFSKEEIKEKLSDCFSGIISVSRLLATIWDIHQYNKHKPINERVIKYIMEYDVNLSISEEGLDVLHIRIDLDELPVKELFDFLSQMKMYETYFVRIEKDNEWILIED